MTVENIQTRNLYLRSISAIYMFAFGSIYLQIQGLYGEDGILPAHTQVPSLQFPKECFGQTKTLLCYTSVLGLNVSYMMELISLAGLVLGLVGFVWVTWCNSVLFSMLYIFYLSIHKAGQTFMWFQWDSLLLEAGFLTIFVAPLWRHTRRYRSSNDLSMWLVRWLLFRLMFASGVVKLQSGCPTWWGLSALEVHFESQCLPTPFAWFMHHLPLWVNRLSVVTTLVTEIAVPFFFFSPIRDHRIFAFYSQVLLQSVIIVSGNYNFFNLITLALCLSLVDDVHLGYRMSRSATTSFLKRAGTTLLKWLGFVVLGYFTLAYFSLRLDAKGGIAADIVFSKGQFEYWVTRTVPLAIVIGVISILITIGESLTSALFETRGTFEKVKVFSSTLTYSFLATILFSVSLVPLTTLDKPTNQLLLSKGAAISTIYRNTQAYEITSSYGLFRHMTGVGGRPEVILEGANKADGPWIEYDFHSKPGKLSRVPPFIQPHQPRLDWQLWFAALGTYSQHPWIVSLSYRLLKGEKHVIQLLHSSSPWRKTPPKYIRAQKYLYFFTDANDTSGNWWRRKLDSTYFPTYSVDHTPLLDYLRKQYLIGTKDIPVTNKVVTGSLDKVREIFQSTEPQNLLWGLFVAGLIIILTGRRRRRN